MGRHSLSTVMALGAVISLIGGAGLFAVFTDRATTGENSAITGERPHLEAIQVSSAAIAPDLSVACGTFSDDLATALITVADLQPGGQWGGFVCVKNVSSLDLTLSATAIDLLDQETACSGDEGSFDSTCAVGSDGELSGVLNVYFGDVDCATAVGTSTPPNNLAALGVGGSAALGTLSAGTTRCLFTSVGYPFTASALEQQIAQTDQATWRFAFDATE
jgi:hypothetical protein